MTATALVNNELMRHLTNNTYTESACSADTRTLYNLNTVLWAGSTPSCEEVVIATNPEYGMCLFLDKEIQSSSSDEAIYHEHLVHPVLNATAAKPAKNVLIVGGGEGATAREVLKWSDSSVASVAWVDIDGPLVTLCRRHMAYATDDVYNDPRLTYTAADIRTFLAATETQYDVILLDLPDPDTDSLRHGNADELYSAAFFELIRSHLAAEGVVATHCGPVLPGGDPEKRRAGLSWIQETAVGITATGSAYRVYIPSFQGDWGFWMSTPPSSTASFPEGLAVMDLVTQTAAFTWPAYWNSSFVGIV